MYVDRVKQQDFTTATNYYKEFSTAGTPAASVNKDANGTTLVFENGRYFKN